MAEIENGAVFDPAAGEPAPRRSIYDLVKTRADELAVSLTAEELAALAERSDMGESELQAVASVFEYLAEKHHETTIATMLKMSRLPRKEPKTFGNFDYGRIQGRDAGALRKLSALSNCVPSSIFEQKLHLFNLNSFVNMLTGTGTSTSPVERVAIPQAA